MKEIIEDGYTTVTCGARWENEWKERIRNDKDEGGVTRQCDRMPASSRNGCSENVGSKARRTKKKAVSKNKFIRFGDIYFGQNTLEARVANASGGGGK